MPYLNEKSISNVVEYLNFIFDFAKNYSGELWYRGHRDNSWKLRPSLFRDAIQDIDDEEIQIAKYKNYLDYNKAILEFRKNNQHIDDEDKLNLFHYTFLAQHYGLPTFALDWTTDPLVALFFAVYQFKFEDEKKFPVIYILKPSKVNEMNINICKKNKEPISEPLPVDYLDDDTFKKWFSDLNKTPCKPLPLAVKSEYDLKSHRISRQSGVFTLHDAVPHKGTELIDFYDNEKNSLGIKIKIDPQSVKLIKEQLRTLDLTEETIYGNKQDRMDIISEAIKKQTPKI